MLRRRTRSHQKDQNIGHIMSDVVPESYFQSDKTKSFFNLPGLFVGFSPKSEPNSARSPTSPLDLRGFSNLGNPCRSQKSSNEGHSKSWNCRKVGLGIIDSLDDETKQSGKVSRSSDTKNILFGPQMHIKTPNLHSHIDYFEASKSLPKNVSVFPYGQVRTTTPQMGNSGVLFEIGEVPLEAAPSGKILSCSLDSGRSGSNIISYGNFGAQSRPTLENSSSYFTRGTSNLGNSPGKKLISIPAFASSDKAFTGTLSASEIELSEDYTCVKTYGSNAKTIHFFGDCILECHNNEFTVSPRNEEQEIKLPQVTPCSEAPTSYSSKIFLSFCNSCKKKLDGKDIYMYRGEKAFCSWSCRSQEILIEEAMEKSSNDSSKNSVESNNRKELFETGLFIAT